MKVGLIFGTRPEAIKMAPVYYKLKEYNINVKVILTGQHKEMLYQVLNLFEIKPDYNLRIMKPGQELSELTSRMINKLDIIIKKEEFDYILVQGDTTSSFVEALVGFYNQIPIGHIEAGLRSKNIYSPFPEEANRRLTGVFAQIHFTPTEVAKNNLLKEGYCHTKVVLTGNTIIDALHWVKNNKAVDIDKVREKYGLQNKKYILITMHRRENWGRPMRNTLRAIRKYLQERKDFHLVFPMHLNPIVREVVYEELRDLENKTLTDPLGYLEFVALMDGAHFIMTDSGGIQEEAPSLGKPILILRNNTERPESLEAGTGKLVGTDTKEVYRYMKLLEGKLYNKMAKIKNPYGDGKAAERILKNLLKKIELE